MKLPGINFHKFPYLRLAHNYQTVSLTKYNGICEDKDEYMVKRGKFSQREGGMVKTSQKVQF